MQSVSGNGVNGFMYLAARLFGIRTRGGLLISFPPLVPSVYRQRNSPGEGSEFYFGANFNPRSMVSFMIKKGQVHVAGVGGEWTHDGDRPGPD